MESQDLIIPDGQAQAGDEVSRSGRPSTFGPSARMVGIFTYDP